MIINNSISQLNTDDLQVIRLKQLSLNEQDYQENYNYDINCLFRTFFFAHTIKQGRQVKTRLSELSQKQNGQLAPNDLPNIKFADTCLQNGKEVWFNLNQKILRNQVTIYDIYKSLFLNQKWLLFLTICYFIIHVSSRIGVSLFIYLILQAVRNDQKTNAYIFASAASLCLIIDRFSFNNGLLYSGILKLRLRSSITFTIYYKLSTLSSYWIKKTDMGSVINMVSSDLNRIQKKISQVFIALAAIVGIIASTILLFFILGWTSIIAIVVIAIGYLLDMIVGKIIAIYLQQASNHKDKRINILSQIIQGVKFIKLYGWEQVFEKIVKNIRRKQAKSYLKFAIGSGIERAFGHFAYLAIIITLAITYYIDNEKLNLAIIFSAVEVSSSLKKFVYFASLGGTFVFKLNVIFTRLSKILNIQNIRAVQIDPYTKIPVQSQNNVATSQDLLGSFKEFNIHEIILKPSNEFINQQVGEVKFINFNGYWNIQNLQAPTLKNINIHFKSNLLYGIGGKISSGKSGLLGAILKQIPYYSGAIDVIGTISYVEQQPAIFQGTIKSNVLFGKQMDESKYAKALHYSCLKDDLNTIQGRDQGIVGEKGNTLSGGQKRRLSLARALYANSDIYLFDDPLSAVDSKVAQKIFTKCFKEYLKDKTVIFCSHQTHFLQRCDQVVIMNDGAVQNQGTPYEIAKQLQSLNINSSEDEDNEEKIDKENSIILSQFSFMQQAVNVTSQVLINDIQEKDIENIQEKQPSKPRAQTNICNFFKYIFYSRGNIILFPIILVIFAGGQVLYYFFSKFLAEYDNQVSQKSQIQKKFASIHIFWIVIICFMIAYCFLVVIKFFLIYVNSIKSATKILHGAVKSSIRAQTNFFDKDESNGLINKFSNDISILDELLPNSLFNWLQGTFIAVIKISSIFTINPYFIPLGVLNLIIPIVIYLYFKNAIVSTISLYLETKNNIYRGVNRLASGSIPIKIYGQRINQLVQFCKTIDTSMKCSLSFDFISRAFTACLTYSTQILIAAGIIVGVFNSSSQTVGQLGIIILFLIQANADIQFCLKQHMVVETQVLSAQRALEILNLPSESKLKVQYDEQIGVNNKGNVQDIWPKNPNIKIQNLKMRYRPELPLALKGLNLQINAYEKVGIVGRTGAGKSSIIQVLLRMYEPEQGTIYEIGGDNVLRMGLHSLRHHITVIPQSPFLFEGTIRENLDPLQQCCDQEIWQALKNSGLAQCIQKLPEKLNTQISKSSGVFSLGQKQLICLARALLKKNKILILDEATSNVDMHTDDFIQKILKEKFKHITILTIAHRLNTIADYDKIIVMNEGQAVQVGTPHQLILKKGFFAKMVQRTGKNAEKIKKIASDAALSFQS